MVSYEHSIKNIYLGDEGRREPWTNTVCYFPFKEDLNDVTWNITLTQNNCTISDGCLNINGTNSYLQPNRTIGGSIITISLWYYYREYNTTGEWSTLFAKQWGTYHHLLINWKNNTPWSIGFYNSGWYSSWTVKTPWQWLYLTVTKNGTNEKIYCNWDKIMDSNSSFDNNTQPIGMFANYNTNQNQWPMGKYSELIVENWNRDDTYILDYYNKTKKNYQNI